MLRVQRRTDIVISLSLPLSAYLCISIHGYRCVYLYLYIYTCIYLYTYIYIYIYACVSTFYVFVCVCVFVCACVRACVCVCMCLCLSLDIDIFRSVHIYAYTPKRGGGVVCLRCVGPRRFGLGVHCTYITMHSQGVALDAGELARLIYAFDYNEDGFISRQVRPRPRCAREGRPPQTTQ